MTTSHWKWQSFLKTDILSVKKIVFTLPAPILSFYTEVNLTNCNFSYRATCKCCYHSYIWYLTNQSHSKRNTSVEPNLDLTQYGMMQNHK